MQSSESRPYQLLDGIDKNIVAANVAKFMRYAATSRLKIQAHRQRDIPIKRKQIVRDRIMEWIKGHQPVTILSISRGIEMKYTTVLKRVNQLEEDGVLRIAKHDLVEGSSRPSKFFAINQ